MSEFNQTSKFTEVVSSIPGIFYQYLASKMKEAVDVAIRLQSNKLKEETEVENQEFFNQVDLTIKAIIKEQVKAQVSKIMPQIKKYVTESLGAEVLVRSTNQPQTSYAVAASLSEFQLKKILIDKIETNKSINRSNIQKNLYNALVEAYNSDKDIITLYGEDVKLSKGSKSKESKSSSSSKGTQSQPKSLGKSTQAKQSEFKAVDTEMQQDQGNESGHIDDQPDNEAAPKHDWFQKPNKPPTPDPINDQLDWHNPEGRKYLFDLSKPLTLIEDRGRQVVPADYFINNDLENLKGGSSSSKYVTSTTRTNAAKYDNIEGIKDMGPKQQRFYAYACHWKSPHDVYSKRRIIAVTSVQVMRWYDYGYLEEIVVRRDDNVLYKFKEGDFPRLNLCDIKDMLLLLFQKKLSNLDVDDRYDLGVALRMFTRRIVILHCVEDLQLGVESYQKKLNITRPETTRSNISKLTPYTAYKNPQGIIYQDKYKRNRLMRSDELYKFGDGMLSSVRRVLYDIASNLEMDYLPKRHWSNLEIKRYRIMVKVIDKLLFERRLMRNLEKFVGGRDYGNDLRLLEWTI
ncbi:hypothetical protein Tco_1172978 [Tanacetum coccineum]